jgi:hypothetical protein
MKIHVSKTALDSTEKVKNEPILQMLRGGVNQILVYGVI